MTNTPTQKLDMMHIAFLCGLAEKDPYYSSYRGDRWSFFRNKTPAPVFPETFYVKIRQPSRAGAIAKLVDFNWNNHNWIIQFDMPGKQKPKQLSFAYWDLEHVPDATATHYAFVKFARPKEPERPANHYDLAGQIGRASCRERV